jgi:PAS domain S-box-containing protein/putative nucleotidyltransferase with HDIG domain
MAEDLPELDAAVDNLKRSYDKQKVITALLQLSMEDIPLEELLQRTLDLLNTIDWIALESKGSIFLVEDQPEVLVMKVQKGMASPILEACRRTPIGRCLCGLAASTRQIQFADGLDERHEIRTAGMPPHGHYCVPILCGDRVLGVINLYVKAGHRHSPQEAEFLAAIANTLAGIIVRREAEAARQRSEQEFRLLVKNLPAIVFKGYLDGSIDLFDDKVEEMTGYPKKEFDSRALKWTDLILDEDRPEAKQEFVAALKSCKPYLREYRIRRQDREPIWIQERSHIICEEEGDITYVIGVFFDISERKQGEVALKHSEERFKAVVESAHDAIISADSRGNIVSWNKSAQTIFGYRAEEILGRPITLLMPKRYRQAHQAGLERIHCLDDVGHIGRTQELYGLRQDGEEFPLELSLSAGKVPEGIFFTAIIRDITDRQRVQEALKRTVEKLKKTVQATVRALTSALEMRDPYTVGHQKRVTDLACAIAKEIGFSEEQIEGMRIIGYLHDIGKIAVPAEILTKPGKISEHEFNIIKTHAEAGYNILKEIDFPCDVAKVVAQHHERLDGSGYPKGLSGSEILIEARILAVADVVEAMSSHRPYRPGLGTEAALQEITEKKDILYDPGVVDICVKLFTEKGFAFE